MTALASVGTGLQAAFRLAQGRGDGILLLAGPPDEEAVTARRSFLAIVLCLPAFLSLRLMDWAQNGPPSDPAHGLTLDLLSYVVGWIGFALVSHALAARLGRAGRWQRFIAAWNWCNAVQYLLMVAATLPDLAGLPGWMGETAWVVGFGWAMWLEWYATRLSLAVGPLVAGVVVLLDFTLGIALAAVMTG